MFSKASQRDSDITASALGDQRILIDSSRGLIPKIIPKPIHHAKKKKKRRPTNDVYNYINKL